MSHHGKSAVADPPRRPPTEPLIERVTGWSVRHRALAIGGWVGLIVLAVLAGGLVSGPSAPGTDTGEAGMARRVLNRQHAYDPARENVLVTSRTGGTRYAKDPELRAATAELVDR